jgi:hypothetical protein
VSLQHLEGGHNIFRPPDFDSADFKSKGSGCCAYLAQFQRGSGVAAVTKIASRRIPGRISRKSSSRLVAISVDCSESPVMLPPGETRDETRANWVVRYCEDNRNGCRHPLCPEEYASRRDDDVNLEPDELARDLGSAFVAPFRPAILNRHAAAFESPVSLSSGDEVPHIYTKIAPTAKRIFDHQCKKTFATISAMSRLTHCSKKRAYSIISSASNCIEIVFLCQAPCQF